MTYTLTAETGTFNITGQAVSMFWHHVITASATETAGSIAAMNPDGTVFQGGSVPGTPSGGGMFIIRG